MKTSVIWSDGAFKNNTAPLQGPLLECVSLAAQYGYDGITISAKDAAEIDVPALKEALKANDISVSGISTGGIFGGFKASLGSAEEEKRALAVEKMCGLAKLCNQLDGARLVVAAVRGRVEEAGSRKAYEAQLRKSLSEILEVCEPLGVTVLMEAMEAAAFQFCNTIEETAEFVKSFNSPYLRLQVDTYHIHGNAEEKSYVEAIKKYGNLIAQADFSDFDRTAPDGTKFDFKEYLEALEAIHYDDWCVFEYAPEPPENAAKTGLDYIKSLL